MKISQFYFGFILSLLSVPFITGGCSDEYEYSSDYSAYDGITLSIDLVDQDNVLNLNLINGTYNVTVSVVPESIIINPHGYIYEIEDETIATIDEEGMLTMLKEGETKLTVKFRGNQEVLTSCTLRISPILTEELNVPESIAVQEEKTYNLLDEITVVPSQASSNFTYQVADPGTAAVSEDGIVTGVKEGNTTITVTTTDGTNISKEIPVEVKGKIYISDITLPSDKITGKNFVVGQVLNVAQFTTLEPENASEPESVEYSVETGDESIIEVTEDGIVTCKAAGTATLLVKASDGNPNEEVTAQIDITVVASGWYERSFWTIDTSYRFVAPNGTIYNYTADDDNGAPEFALDGDPETYFSLVKPEMAPYTDPGTHFKFPAPEGDMFFVVDMGAKIEFNKFKWRHRGDQGSGTQIRKVSLFGSDDGSSFTAIKENITLSDSRTEDIVTDIPLSNYRYIKVQFMEYDTKNYRNVAVTEFNVFKE